MTRLRRAPREVYRVYGEEEFFADPTPHAEHVGASSSDSAERQLQRLAGATVLLVTVGVVGGMIVLTSVSSTAHRCRGGARSSAASGSLPSGGGRIAGMDASSGMPVAHARPGDRGHSSGHVDGHTQQAGSRGRPLAAPAHSVRPRVAATHTATVQDPAQVVPVATAGAPVSVGDPTTLTSTSSTQPAWAEFGFER